MATKQYIPTPEPVSAERGMEILDRQAQRWLHISGEEFLARWDAGEFNDEEHDRPEVVRVAALIPLARQR